jgi:hypothetical protein
MAISHFELLVEEQSMEAFLRALLPRVLPEGRTFEVHPFQGKSDLFGKLEDRLRGYAAWLPEDWQILVVVDRDDDDCKALKAKMERLGKKTNLATPSTSKHSRWQLVNRIAIEELEAWYFSDWEAVRTGFPRVSANIPLRQGFRNSDAILGGTWEAFERVLQRHGYFEGGLPKIEAARIIGTYFDVSRSNSPSFHALYGAFQSALQW